MSENNSFQTGHVGLNVTNIERSKQFYQIVFGFKVTSESHEDGRHYAFLGRDNKLFITLWQQSDGDFNTKQPGLHHLSFRVDSIEDVQVYEQRLKAINANFLYNGVVPHSEGAQSGGIFFTDPDGIRLEIYAPSGADVQDAPTSHGPSCGFF